MSTKQKAPAVRRGPYRNECDGMGPARAERPVGLPRVSEVSAREGPGAIAGSASRSRSVRRFTQE